MKVIGISETHSDSGCALFIDGELIFAANEERFSRYKRHRGFPYKSLNWILAEAGLSLYEIDKFSIAKLSAKSDIRAYINSITLHYRNSEPESKLIPLLIDKFVWFCLMIPYCFVATYLLNFEINRWIKKNNISKNKVKRVLHHPSHAYSGYYCSGFDSALVITMDGQGLGVSATISEAVNGNCNIVDTVLHPNSVGQFYSLVTLACGFLPNRHEGKITGLAAHGKYIYELQKFVDSLIEFKNGTIKANAIFGHYFTTKKMLKRYGKENLSYAFQRRLESIVIDYITFQINNRKYFENVVLSGGVFANVQLNQRIKSIKGIKRVYIYPHMADGGSSVGAAYIVSHKKINKKLKNLYLGPKYEKDEIRKSVDIFNLAYSEPKDLSTLVAKLLLDGKIVARFDGRMEFGPRALGNRSILMSTTNKNATNILNQKLKRNEFMPFAPVTLLEEADKCYLDFDPSDPNHEFMTITLNCSERMKELSPGVVHINGTARPQILSRKMNPSFYDILSKYYELSGIPSIINTSFNLHDEPIVCTPIQAITSCINGKFDALVIGPFLVDFNHD